MSGYSVLIKDISINMKFKKSKNVLVQNVKLIKFLERENVKVIKGKVVLYKRVSKDFKTQENTSNETLWTIGSVVEHKNWFPKDSECGSGKFHACSEAFFCDEFRNELRSDKYIAIEVSKKDLYEWKNPSYPHKIAFRKCKVLYECYFNGERV